VDSSPSNGLFSTNPYAKRWSAASTAAAGDVHFYDYDMDCEDASGYPAARFVSEFGFQGQPSFFAYAHVTQPQDWARDSPLLQFRQRHEHGDEQMRVQAARHFKIPEETPGADNSVKAEELGNYFYLLQVQQAQCYETAINRWRQLQTLSGQRHTMGILYWQLNDIWQGPSWASMENSGRFRVLQYAVRRAFSPLSVSFAGEAVSPSSTAAAAAANRQQNSTASSAAARSGEVAVWAVNDQKVAQYVHVTVYAEPWSPTNTDNAPSSSSSHVLWESAVPVSVASSSSLMLAAVPLSDDALLKAGCTRDTCYLRAATRSAAADQAAAAAVAGGNVPDSFFWLGPLKDAQLAPNPTVTITNVRILASDLNQGLGGDVVAFDMQVSATTPFFWLELNTPDKGNSGAVASALGVYGAAAGWFSNNGFVAKAAQVYSLTYTSHLPGTFRTAEEFRQQLKYRTLQAAQGEGAKA
jgi:beta-mannosidase